MKQQPSMVESRFVASVLIETMMLMIFAQVDGLPK